MRGRGPEPRHCSWRDRRPHSLDTFVPPFCIASQGLCDGSPRSRSERRFPPYSLQREAEDVAAVVNSRPGTVFLLGHSYGGVCALEAAFLTNKISKLVLYEPALQNLDNSAVLARMEKMIQEGNRDEALVTFLQEIVMISPSEVIAMKARPSWPGLLATIDS